ncbi:TPA: Dot/Icm T4SS effector Lem10, partial [Legionella pneumophila]
MVKKIIWISNNGKPNLKMEFVSEEEKNKFFKEVKTKASELGLNFPLVQGSGNSLLIEASNYPANPCG